MSQFPFRDLLKRYGEGEVTTQEVVDYINSNSQSPDVYNEIDELPIQDTSWVYVTVALGKGDISSEQYNTLRDALIKSNGALK